MACADAPTDLNQPGSVGTQQSSLRTLAEDNLEFAASLHSALAREPGNRVFSPYSAAVALATLYTGAGGTTAQQLASATHWGERFWAMPFSQDLRRRMAVHQANSVWVQDGLDMSRDYPSMVAMAFGAEVEMLDFARNPMGAQAQIDRWVSTQTGQSLPHMLDSINQHVRLVATSVVHLGGEWLHPTTPLDNGRMLRQVALLHYADTPDVRAVELPYADGAMSLLVIVPKSDMQRYEASMTGESLLDLLHSMRQRRIDLRMPTFSLSSSLNLRQPLVDLGVVDAFTPGRANFCGIDQQRRVFLHDVWHQTSFAVTPEGTVAASGAAGGGVVLAAPLPDTVLQIDAPFIFIVRDLESNAPIVMGRIENPT